MSKLNDKIEKYYMDKFNTMFDEEEASNKMKSEAKSAPDGSFMEDIIKEINEDADKAARVFLYEDQILKKKKMIAEQEEDDMLPAEEESEEEPSIDEGSEEEMSEEDMDDMDKADEVLQEIDLSDMDNATRLELIRSIIDSAQNQSGETTEEGEEEISFDDFISQVLDVVDEFQYEEQPEEMEEEPTEEEMPEEEVGEGEELPEEEMPEEAPAEGEEEVI